MTYRSTLMTLIAGLACACAAPDDAAVSLAAPSAQALGEHDHCAPLGVDLVPDDNAVVVHGARDPACGAHLFAELMSEDGRRIAMGELPVDLETGRFGERLEFFEPPPFGIPLTLYIWGESGVEQIQLVAQEGPNGVELVAPTPEPLTDMTGDWLLTTRRPGSGEDSAPAYARVFQDGPFIEVVEACHPERRIATGWIEGEHFELFDAESEQPLGVGSASPYHMQTFLEAGETVDVLEGLRLEGIDCEGEDRPTFATPYAPRQAVEQTLWTGLSAFNGFTVLEPDERILERREFWPDGLPHVHHLPPSAPNGMDHLMAAGKTPWPVARQRKSTTTGAKVCTDSTNGHAPMTCPADGAGTAAYQECIPTSLTADAVMTLSNRVLLTADNDVYPGALLQGRTIDNGTFAPITVPRAGTRLTMVGPSLANPNININAVSLADVEQARQTLIRRPIQSTSNRLSIDAEEVYSLDDLLVKADAHVKWGAGDFKAKFSFQNSATTNSVLMRFNQELYRIVAARPTTAADAFRDGRSFNDDNFQIGADNRPVFVSEVGYGRQLFLLVQSKHTIADIKASLNVAVSGNSAGASVIHKRVLNESTVSFVALGGDTQQAAAPLGSVTNSGGMFKAVADAAANFKGLGVSPTNAAVPVAYTFTDLLRGDKLRSAYSISHTRRDCVARDGRPFKVELIVRSVNEGLDVWITPAGTARSGNAHQSFSLIHPARSGYGRSVNADLTPRLQTGGGGARRITLVHHNSGCFFRWADVRVNVDGIRKFSHQLRDNGWGHCGVYMEADMRVDPATGAFNLGSIRN